MKKAILFDRDGTLIVDKIYLNDPEQIEYFPGVFRALREMRDMGYLFFVVTNQSGVPRGLVSLKNLYEIHRRMRFAFAAEGVDLLEFYYAPYLTHIEHIYRKPNPGMILQAAHEYNLDLAGSWMVGDRMSDVEAGHRAGTRSVLLGDYRPGVFKPEGYQFGEYKPENYKSENVNSPWAPPEILCANIVDAVTPLKQLHSRKIL